MSATIAGAFKAYLETLGLGVPVYRDGAPVVARGPDGDVLAAPPYVVVQDGVGVTPSLLGGDLGDSDADRSQVELVQVDLFQLAREQVSATRTRTTEDPVLIARIGRALTGTGIRPHAPVLVYAHRVTGGQRWPISDNVARYTWTVEVQRGEVPLAAQP